MRPTFGRVDVGGYELAWMCQGEGSPTIIAEAGYDSAGTSTYFESMGPMSDISRVCTYDRAGTGTSDHRPAGMHVTSLLQAKELHALLEGAAIDASVRRSSLIRTAASSLGCSRPRTRRRWPVSS